MERKGNIVWISDGRLVDDGPRHHAGDGGSRTARVGYRCAVLYTLLIILVVVAIVVLVMRGAGRRRL